MFTFLAILGLIAGAAATALSAPAETPSSGRPTSLVPT